MKSGIYRYTNLINGKRYIGQAGIYSWFYDKTLNKRVYFKK